MRTAIPTRRTPLDRLRNLLQRAVTAMRIRSAERDIRCSEREAMRTDRPVDALFFRNQASQWRRDVQAMRVELILLESQA